jgi:hypothetical protein
MQTDKPTTEPGRVWPRRLRICMASVCLTLCFTTVAFWAQSYRQIFFMGGEYFNTLLIGVLSEQGRIIIGVEGGREPAEQWFQYKITPSDQHADWPAISGGQLPNVVGFNDNANLLGAQRAVKFPHWSLVLLFGSLAVLFRPPPRMRFGLRELFVVVTLAAVVLGAVEATIQAAGPGPRP